MSEFTRTFLNEDWENAPNAPRIYVGAFGKHPGWNDHLDDIGLATSSLVAARRVLYGAGISSQIESAAWDKAGPEKTLPEFDHIFLWRRAGESIAGLIWASRDGKGRRLYPMVLAAHCVGQRFEWIAREALPALEGAAAHCRATTDAARVVSTIALAQQTLRRSPGAESENVHEVDSDLGVARWAEHFDQSRPLLLRVFYHLKSQLAWFAPGSAEWSPDGGPGRSRVLRLPSPPGASATEALNAWLGFLGTQLDPAAPLFGAAPREQPWVDVIVGEPSPADFYALKANAAGLPAVTEIPYQIDDALRDKLAGVFDDLALRKLPGYSIFNGETVEANREAADKWLARFRGGSRRGLFSRILRPNATRGFTRFVQRSS